MDEIKGKKVTFFYADEAGNVTTLPQIDGVTEFHATYTGTEPPAGVYWPMDWTKWSEDQEELQHKLIMDSSHPPVAQSVEAPDSNPVQSEFESQQEDQINPACPQCGMCETLHIRQVIKQEDYQPIYGVTKKKDGVVFMVGEPSNELFLDVLESYLMCSNCAYEARLDEDAYSVIGSGYGGF